MMMLLLLLVVGMGVWMDFISKILFDCSTCCIVKMRRTGGYEVYIYFLIMKNIRVREMGRRGGGGVYRGGCK